MEEMARHFWLRNNESKKLRSSSREGNMALDSKVWGRLPDSVLSSVFQFLAWEDVFRFRAVRKEWNLFLRSPVFKMAWQKDPDQTPICFASSAKINSYFNPATRRWHISGIDLPPSLCAAGRDLHKHVSKKIRGRRFPVVSAVKGFLLIQMYTKDAVAFSDRFRDVENGEPRDVRDDFMLNFILEGERDATAVDPLLVGVDDQQVDGAVHPDSESHDFTLPEHREMLLIVNPLEPLSKACIKAVPYLQENYCQHEIIWDPKLGTYELLARSADVSQDQTDGNCLWSIVFHRYDFSSGLWTKIVSWSTHRFISLESSCLIGGQLVCLGRPATMRPINPKPYRIYGTELSQTLSIEEMELTAPKLPFSLAFAVLFWYEGMYVVAGGHVSSRYATLRNFKVWKKHELFSKDGDSEWIQVLQMPKHLLAELNNCALGPQYTCKADGRFICIANRSTDVVMCDMEKETWWRLPKHPRGRDAASEGLALCDPRFDVRLTL